MPRSLLTDLHNKPCDKCLQAIKTVRLGEGDTDAYEGLDAVEVTPGCLVCKVRKTPYSSGNNIAQTVREEETCRIAIETLLAECNARLRRDDFENRVLDKDSGDSRKKILELDELGEIRTSNCSRVRASAAEITQRFASLKNRSIPGTASNEDVEMEDLPSLRSKLITLQTTVTMREHQLEVAKSTLDKTQETLEVARKRVEKDQKVVIEREEKLWEAKGELAKAGVIVARAEKQMLPRND